MVDNRKIVHLQSLRAIAASLVVASHALEYPVRRQTLGNEFYIPAWLLGWMGVATFFVISGLIMVRSTQGQFGSAASGLTFIGRRVLRVVPIYWLMIVPFAAAAIARGETLDADMVFKTSFFIPYLPPGSDAMRPIIGQGWTLNFEMMFYVVFAICLCFRPKLGLALLISSFLAVVVARSLVWPLVPYSDPITPFQFWSDPLILLFVAGIVIGLVESRALRWLAIPFPVLSSLVLYLLVGAAFLVFGGQFPMPIGWQSVVALVCAATVVLCTGRNQRSPRGLDRIMEKLGDASYSAYLVHPLVLMALAALAWKLPGGAPNPFAFVGASVIVCNLAGYLTFRWIERPLGRAVAQLVGSRA